MFTKMREEIKNDEIHILFFMRRMTFTTILPPTHSSLYDENDEYVCAVCRCVVMTWMSVVRGERGEKRREEEDQ